ncbi:MAG: hypothetical protein ACMG51_05700 [Ginsengibacter sp.]
MHIELVPPAKPLLAALETEGLDASTKEVAIQWPELNAASLVDCDPDRLQQVFWNLLTNIIKFTPSQGTVE